MSDVAPRVFRYHVEPSAGPFLAGLLLLTAGLVLPGALRLILALMASGPLAFWALQRVRRGRAIYLGDDGLIVQGSISGRRRVVNYTAIRGVAVTRQGGLGVLYHEHTDPGPATDPQETPLSLDRLRAEAAPDNPAFPPRPRLIVTAPVEDVGALLVTLRRDCPALGGVPAGALDRLIRRRQWRDRLFALVALSGTPLYVMIAARVLMGLL